MQPNLFEIRNLKCSYHKDSKEPKVVLEIDALDIPRGKKIFIVGESGIGKSTILETLGMMNNTIITGTDSRFAFFPLQGPGVNMPALWRSSDENRLSDFRLRNYSFIFQSTNLMKNFTAYENVAFTRMLQGYSRAESFERVQKVLADLGLEHIDRTRMAQELSGGQQQRLAFARAIIPDFTVLFGDEPTGNLDAENALRVMTILSRELDEQQGASAIIVSHDMPMAMKFADVIIKIRKCTRPKASPDAEDQIYGRIDPMCVFTPTGHSWTNGQDDYSLNDFEKFLREK